MNLFILYQAKGYCTWSFPQMLSKPVILYAGITKQYVESRFLESYISQASRYSNQNSLPLDLLSPPIDWSPDFSNLSFGFPCPEVGEFRIPFFIINHWWFSFIFTNIKKTSSPSEILWVPPFIRKRKIGYINGRTINNYMSVRVYINTIIFTLIGTE